MIDDETQSTRYWVRVGAVVDEPEGEMMAAALVETFLAAVQDQIDRWPGMVKFEVDWDSVEEYIDD